MSRLLIVSDCGVPTGYGRIADAVGTRLAKQGHAIYAASYAYDGLLPAVHDGETLPYWVATLAGKPNWPQEVLKLWQAIQPDIVISIQDFPYAEQIYFSNIDWSRTGFIVITPVDGVPIYPAWLDVMKKADAGLTISQYGVEAFRKAGVRVELCRPAASPEVFYPLPEDERRGLRARLGIAPEAFVLGTMAQNQGRKAIPLMLRAFFEFAQDKPDARYLLDMDTISMAGWNIPALCQQFNWPAEKLIFREQCGRAGLTELRERYALLDAHVVIAHREGYGIPLVEAQACGVVSIALDYCSGTEICGGGKGVLIKTTGYGRPGTWGGAEDYDPDMAHFVEQLQWLHDEPEARRMIAQRGMAWSKSQTWQMAADAVAAAVNKVDAKFAAMKAAMPQNS